MTDCAIISLRKFQHSPPAEPRDAPHQWNEATYIEKILYTYPLNGPPPLNPNKTTIVQKVFGTFLYYDLDMDSTMIVDLGGVTSYQATASKCTTEDCIWLINYAATHTNSTIQYKSSEMIL